MSLWMFSEDYNVFDDDYYDDGDDDDNDDL